MSGRLKPRAPARAGAAETSRWRRPNCWATRHATRLEKQSIPPVRPVSLSREVAWVPSPPQATAHWNGCRSLSTFTANPCVVTPRDTWMPMAPILPSPGPDAGEPVAHARGNALVVQRGDHGRLQAVDVGGHVAHLHDRVAHQLAGAVVGQPAAAVGALDVDALAEVPGLAHRQVGLVAAAAQRVDRRVLQQQQRVGQLPGLARRPAALLDRDRLGCTAPGPAGRPRARRWRCGTWSD